MSEDQAGYTTDEQPAVIIDQQRTAIALRDKGLIEYKVWGWVKMSAKFISHIRQLKGAKLAVWNVIALTISEDGKCELSVAEIAELAGYSTSETRATISELDEMGYMTKETKSGKKSIYRPEFVARATNNPTDRPLQETCTPLVGKVKRATDPSSLSIGNSISSIKELKRVKEPFFTIEEQAQNEAKMQAILEAERLAQEANASGHAWRGREFLPAHYLPYGDWWHAKTGLHMYGAKAKPKMDAEWLNACKALWENEVTTTALDAAWKAEEWRAVTKLSQIVPAAKLAQAAGAVVVTENIYRGIKVTK